jgi:hypothetical protein
MTRLTERKIRRAIEVPVKTWPRDASCQERFDLLWTEIAGQSSIVSSLKEEQQCKM